MYTLVLSLHSLVRWLVLASLLYTLYRSYKGWFYKKQFSNIDDALRHWTATTTHIQLVLGLVLYYISPIVEYFFTHFENAVHQREIRFFGMEHSLMMLIAIITISIGSFRAKRKISAQEKFKTMAIWFTIGFLIILSSIPWTFSPLVSRPYVRFF